jgi:DNA-binding CsgD family transcriptional regulator/tetratricopeptide (TPR) repeat protein
MAVSRTALVGRQAELARITTAIEAATRGDPTFVLVLGEAGIGKTSFLRAAAWLAAARGMRTLTGTAIASGSSIPYLPLAAPLRAAVDELPGDDSSARTVRAALGDAPVLSGEESEAARAAGLVEAIYAVLARKPTLLVVDDVHWADGATLTVLDYLAHRAEAAPLAVLAAARNDEPEVLRSLPIADGRRYLQLPLERLGRAAVRDQVAALLGGSSPDSLLEVLFERSAGNPLYVEELLAQVGLAEGSSADDVQDAVPPASLQSLVASRVARLPPAARGVTDALAVLGRTADAAFIGDLAQLRADATDDALQAAERGGVVARRTDGYALRHPLFGEVLARDLATETRGAALHRRAAERLEAAGASPAEVVRHWEAAGDRTRTWSASVAAGQQAEATSAFAEARTHFERASEYWPEGVEGRGQTLLRAAYGAWMVGETDAAFELARRARASGAPQLEALVALGQYAWDAGARAEAVGLFAEAATHLAEDSPPRTRAQALWGLGRARIGQGDYPDAHRLGASVAEVAADAGDLAWVGHGWVLAGMARAWNGEIDGVAELQRGFRASVDSGDPEAIGHAYQFLVELLWMAGRMEEARQIGIEGVPACDRLGLARSHASDLRGATAMVLIDLGAWREAEAILEGAEARAKATFARALLAIRRGEWDAAERDLDASTTDHSIGGRGRLGGLTELGRAELAWLRGARDASLAALDSIPQQPGIWQVDMAARIALWRARLGAPPAPAVTHFDVGFADAVNTELTAARSRNARSWSAAALAWKRLERPYDRAIVLVSAAESLYAAQDRATGRACLEAALESALRLGAQPLVAHAERLARRARISLRSTAPSPVGGSTLTPRETEILHQLAEGRTNPQIAQHLFLSPKTVGIHVSRILDKLGAHTRGEAVATARRRGLLQ